MADWPAFRPVAEHALLVEFGDTVGPLAHDPVLGLDRRLAAAPFPGFREAIPANVNLVVTFDPVLTDHAGARAAIERLLAGPAPAGTAPGTHEIEICYDGPHGRDLEEIAHQKGLTRDEVIAAHLSGSYEVYMYGFAPGYAYLTGLAETLALPRRTAPRRAIEAGNVVIAGRQTLVTTLEMPNGWWIVGRSPTPMMLEGGDHPFPFALGDRVRFRRIGAAELAGRMAGGDPAARDPAARDPASDPAGAR